MRAARHVAHLFGGKSERRINFNRGEAKIIRRHSDHDIALAIETDSFSHQVRISAKALLPQTVTQYRHSTTAGLLLFRQKGATELRLDSQRLEEIRRDAKPVEPLRLITSGQRVAAPGVS